MTPTVLDHLKLWLEDNVASGSEIFFDNVGNVKSADVLAALEGLRLEVACADDSWVWPYSLRD